MLKMIHVKFALLLSIFCVLTGFSKVEAFSRTKREVETSSETNQVDVEKVQEHLMTAFDSFKKSLEELTSKINTGEIVMGIQNLTSVLENYAKKTADQFASTASGTVDTEEKKD